MAMSSDFTPGADDIGAPARPHLCPDHRQSVANLARMDHIDDRESTRVATQIARQCPLCGRTKP